MTVVLTGIKAHTFKQPLLKGNHSGATILTSEKKKGVSETVRFSDKHFSWIILIRQVAFTPIVQ